MTTEAGVLVGTLARALLDGSRDLGTVPGLLIRIIDGELWRDRIDPVSGRRYQFRSWEQFVITSGPDGLGSSTKQLWGLCQENQAARAALERVSQQPDGGDRRSESFNVDNIHTERPSGTSAQQALRRLRTQRTDLHARVVAGELTPHAAMIEAGFREQTISIPLDPQKAARVLVRRFGPERVAALIEALEAQ